ncbi:matrix-remodeling-associated protein 7 isoform X2 [Peromyscus eremicus]|uniref:matrix-remodeling-associated protein 7 isoform X2 n=1 Tax=Peromyscus eremicus TaxID=42410 RepID=UPI0027DD5288|nr:matrix-remodeling-associated protein 7 isoform X2 [Peromyscus eremicus]
MEAPAELLAALPALATALALLLAWLLLRRGAAPVPAPERASPAEAPGAPAPPAPPEPCSPEPAPAGPRQPERMAELGEPAAEEPADEGRQDEEQDSDSETGPPTEEPEEEDGAAFSFKYSPGQLRGSQYKQMMTKEELEEEQRIELTSDLTSL